MIQTIILLVFKMLLFNSSPTYQGPWRPNDEARWLVITSRIQPTPKVRSPINGSLQFRFQTPTQDRGFGILFVRPDLISNKFSSHDIGDISRVWLPLVCPLVYLLSKYLVFQPFIISVNDGNYRNALWALNLTLMFFCCYYPYLRYIRSYLVLKSWGRFEYSHLYHKRSPCTGFSHFLTFSNETNICYHGIRKTRV